MVVAMVEARNDIRRAREPREPLPLATRCHRHDRSTDGMSGHFLVRPPAIVSGY
jgi:hypothetical protein